VLKKIPLPQDVLFGIIIHKLICVNKGIDCFYFRDFDQELTVNSQRVKEVFLTDFA